MSSSEEDWEKDVDSENEETQKKKEEEAKKAKQSGFEDEDKVDAEKKKKLLQKEEAERRAKELEENKRTKKSNKVDYEEKFAQRQAALTGIKPTTTEVKETKGMSAGAKGLILEQAAEKGLTEQLFGGMDEPATVNLNSEKDYKNFGTQTAKVLYAGSAPYRIENFFRELCKDLPEHCDSKQMQKIIDHLAIKQKDLAKKEKEARDGKNKKKEKASLKGGGGKAAYDHNNNAAMINDVMGGDYGEEGEDGGEAAGFQREEEAEYDFM